MRVVQVGIDRTGASYVEDVLKRTGTCLAEDHQAAFTGALTMTARERTEAFAEISPDPGCAVWRIFEFPPNQLYDMHYTETIDFDVVVDGSITLGLDAEEVDLLPGDGVLPSVGTGTAGAPSQTAAGC